MIDRVQKIDSWYILLVGSFLGLLLVIWITDILSLLEMNQSIGPFEILDIYVSALLSALLVYLYREQSKTLDEQKELTKYQQSSQIVVWSYDIFSAEDISEVVDESDIDTIRYSSLITFELENKGQAPAYNLRGYLYIECDEIGRIFMGSALKHRDQYLDQISYNSEGAVIAPQEKSRFENTFFYRDDKLNDELKEHYDGESEIISPSQLLWILVDAGITEVEMGIGLLYNDGRGENEPIQLQTVEVNIREYTSIRTAFEYGTPKLEDVDQPDIDPFDTKTD